MKPRPILKHPTNRRWALVQLQDGTVSIIDAKYSKYVGQCNWYRKKDSGYVATNATHSYTRREYLHRFIAKLADISLSNEIDHRNRDKLDNRVRNLKAATSAENNATQHHKPGVSGVRGVSWNTARGWWIVRVKREGQTTYVGHFSNLKKAARAARKARKQIYGWEREET